MSHIFISYKHEDGDFADVLINNVEKAGFNTWVDNKLHAGDDWRVGIDQAIKDAFALIVIMSSEAQASEYVTYEWAFAWGAGVKVIPVLFKPTKLHPRLEALQYLDFTSRTARPWNILIDILKETISVFGSKTQESLYELLRKSTVRVSVPGRSGHGTGFFFAPGLILTCAHVVNATTPENKSVEVFWEEQKYPAQIKRLSTLPYPDLALLQVDLVNHPCVYLNIKVELPDVLYSYGYTDTYQEGESTTFVFEGWSGSKDSWLKFKSGQVRPGMSGAPLLNLRTGAVCGLVQITRGRATDLGGRAIPTKILFQEFEELKALQQQFHSHDKHWIDCLPPQQRREIGIIANY